MRMMHPAVRKELTAAWEATFGEQLSNESQGNTPSTGPNAFFDEELDWCEQTRRFYSAGGAKRAKAAARARRRQSRRRRSELIFP